MWAYGLLGCRALTYDDLKAALSCVKSRMAGAGSEQKDLLALMYQHLLQIGYGKAARELLLQSGQVISASPTWVEIWGPGSVAVAPH